MRLSGSQFKILSILWTSEVSLSIEKIAELAKYRFAGKVIVGFVIEDLLSKNAVFQVGIYRNYSQEKETVRILYAPAIRFDEYYAEQFKDIAPRNLFRLLKRLLRSDKLDPQMLYELREIIEEITGRI